MTPTLTEQLSKTSHDVGFLVADLRDALTAAVRGPHLCAADTIEDLIAEAAALRTRINRLRNTVEREASRRPGC